MDELRTFIEEGGVILIPFDDEIFGVVQAILKKTIPKLFLHC
jgi:hypothetical protein